MPPNITLFHCLQLSGILMFSEENVMVHTQPGQIVPLKMADMKNCSSMIPSSEIFIKLKVVKNPTSIHDIVPACHNHDITWHNNSMPYS